MMAVKSATARRHTALAVGIALVGMMAMVRGAGVTPPVTVEGGLLGLQRLGHAAQGGRRTVAAER